MRNIDAKTALEIVNEIKGILWLDIDKDGEFWNPDKEWSSDTVDEIARKFVIRNLVPKRRHRVS